MDHHHTAQTPPPHVEIGRLLGYSLHTFTRGHTRCVHLEQREVTANVVGMWGPQSQIFHYMRSYVIQTAPENYVLPLPHPRPGYRQRCVRLHPYPYRWPAYCGRSFFIDWDGSVVDPHGHHFERQRPWHCAHCKSEKLPEHVWTLDSQSIRRIG